MTKEYAPGIPDKNTIHKLPTITKPTTWDYVIHDHEADKRGRHFDLRLGNKETGYAHSWAMLPKMPSPGTNTIIIEQPTHTTNYMNFEGEIPKGSYGAGKVSIHHSDSVEVVNSKPGHISFNVYKSSGPEEYTIHQLHGNIWKLYNRTLKKDEHPILPLNEKPKYKETTIDKAIDSGDDYVMSAKIDDAHNLFYFPEKGERVRIVSYREGKRATGGIIEHTHKVKGFEDLKTPKELANTVVRGGLYAIHPATGKATPHQHLAGMLNSDVWKSRKKQEEHGDLIPVLYDVDTYKGKDMKNAPFKEKLEVLQKIKDTYPNHFDLPRMAITKEEKQELIEAIDEGKLPETEEGVVLHNLHKPEPYIKAKFIKEHEVYIKDFFPGESRLKDKGVGGFYYSHTPEGPIAGKVGTGFTDKERYHMHNHPELYKDMIAVVGSQHRYKDTHALRAPGYLGLHLDKNESSRLSSIYNS